MYIRERLLNEASERDEDWEKDDESPFIFMYNELPTYIVITYI